MLLMTPGPTPVPEAVVLAMSAPMIPHRSSEFEALLARVRPRLSEVFRTSGPVLAFAGSGTSAMESAIWSLLEPGEGSVSVSCGRFGERWGAALDRWSDLFGGARGRAHREWGSPAPVDELSATVTPETALVTVTQSETSTGGWTNLRAVIGAVRERAPEALVVADVVTGVGAIELEMEAWGVDVCVAASQKALMLPPGMGLVALGPRAIEKLRRTTSAAPTSMDLRWRLAAYENGTVANTPPMAHWFGLDAALELILTEGLPARWARVSRLAARTRERLTAIGYRLAAAAPVDSVTAAWYPYGKGDEVRQRCAQAGVVLEGGQDQWKGRVLRMSHMGAVDEAMTERALRAIEDAGRPG